MFGLRLNTAQHIERNIYVEKVYLDNACTSIVRPEVLQCYDELKSLLSDPDITAGDANRQLRSYAARTREAVAGFIHCDTQEVALVESTSHALGMLANIIPLKQTDNVLVCDLEYLASVLCWKRRQEQVGFEIRRVYSHDDRVDPEDFESAMDENTRVILVASVQEINGFRADVKEIARIAHRHNCLVIVDGIQEAGALRVDVRDSDVDFYCAGGKKWMGNPFGMGFLYIRKELLGKLLPDYYSYFKIDIPEEYHGDFITYLENPNRTPFDPFTLHQDASAFEIGGYSNYLGALGLAKSIEVLEREGIDAIEARIRMLVRRLLDGLEKLPVTICSPLDDAHLSPTVSFNFGLKGGSSHEKKLETYLISRKIYVSLRCNAGTGGIRVSINYYNSEQDVDTLLSAVSAFIAGEAASFPNKSEVATDCADS